MLGAAALFPPVLWLFPALALRRAPTFRDQGDFFYPLKLYTADRLCDYFADSLKSDNKELRDTVRFGTSKVYANGKGSRNALVPGDLFTTQEVLAASEALETNNSPKWGNDFYVCFAHPHQLIGLRTSAGWINANQYAGSSAIFFGESGRFNDVRFVMTSMMSNGKNSSLDSTGQYADPAYDPLLDPVVTAALGTVVYQAVMFGEYAYGHAIALPVELRDNGIQDFGREHALAWYGIWGQGLLEVNNSVVVETA